MEETAPFDAIVAGSSIHHQPDERKRSLNLELFSLLRPGGVFLNLEHVASASGWGERLFDEHFAASLVFKERVGLFFMTGGYHEHHILAIQLERMRGHVTQTHVAWRTNRGAAWVPSPITRGDQFLVVSDSGVAHCFEAATGRILWQERTGEHHASLVSANGLVYFLNDDGGDPLSTARPRLFAGGAERTRATLLRVTCAQPGPAPDPPRPPTLLYRKWTVTPSDEAPGRLPRDEHR